MATIIPIDNKSFTTAGEKRFYHFLRTTVKPDGECVGWYSPFIEGVEPDFVLYTAEVGLVVFEVKDWVLGQIQKADQHNFTLTSDDGHQEKRTNPLQQARSYVFAILNRLKSLGKTWLSDDPRHQGKPKLPVHGGVVFTNITRQDFEAAGLAKVISPEIVFFADDLALAEVKGGGLPNIRQKLAAMFPPLFPFQLTAAEFSHLREIFWPEVRLKLPSRAGKKTKNEPEISLQFLDQQQESLACRLDATWALVEGPAGSGKTLVLVHKALRELQRQRNRGNDLPILILCYNLTLVHYLKRLLALHQAPLGRRGLRIMHFYEFCCDILNEPLNYEKEEANYYQLVAQMALEAAPASPSYSAVFVDEGQDFSDSMMAVPRAVCQKGGLFWVALDTAQTLYKPSQDWKSDPAFKKYTLSTPYRATPALALFCEKLITKDDPKVGQAPLSSPNQGRKPRLHQRKTLKDAAQCMAERIKELQAEGVPYSEIVVLYACRKLKGLEGQEVPRILGELFEENGILCFWASQDAHTKSLWDITTDSVAISTIHSMKGLDAEAVIIWGLDDLDRRNKPEESIRALAYAASSRARRSLDIIYRDRTPLIENMAAIIAELSPPA